MSDFRTSADLLSEALTQAGESSADTSSLTSKMLEYLNDAYIRVLSGNSEFDEEIGDPFPWARDEDPGTLILESNVDADTVALTNASKDGVFFTAPVRSMRGRHIFIENRAEPYLIRTHIAGATAFKIDVDFLGPTGSHNYNAIKLIYDLGDEILRLVEPFRVYENQRCNDRDMKIYGRELNNFRTEYPLSRVRLQIPIDFAIVNQKEEGFKIQMNSFVGEDIRVDFDKVSIPDALTNSNNSIPLIPINHRRILSYMASSSMLFNEKNDSAKGSVMFNIAQGMWNSMRRQHNKQTKDTSRSRGRIIPRLDLYCPQRRNDLFNERSQ